MTDILSVYQKDWSIQEQLITNTKAMYNKWREEMGIEKGTWNRKSEEDPHHLTEEELLAKIKEMEAFNADRQEEENSSDVSLTPQDSAQDETSIKRKRGRSYDSDGSASSAKKPQRESP